MQLSCPVSALTPVFDEPNLIASAGLVTAVGLAQQVGLQALADEHVKVPKVGANAGLKIMSLVAGMCAGADSISDMGMLRHGAMSTVFDGMRAPSTLGTYLRGVTFGHGRQFHAVASRVLIRLVRKYPELLAGIDAECLLDIDDTLKAVYGSKKQGAEVGYTKVCGLNVQIAALSTALSAPLIVETELRRGAKNSSHGGVQMIRNSIATARRCGAKGQIMVRADSAYCTSAIIAAIVKARASFSMAISQNERVQQGIASISEDAWTRIEYPQAILDKDTGELVSAAEIAEIEFTAFKSKAKRFWQTGRLIVRRVPELNKEKLAGQNSLFPVFRYHAVFTNSTKPLIEADLEYRAHAIIEQVIADQKGNALAHLPSGVFNANAAWVVCAQIAFNLTRAMGVAAGGSLRKASTATIRTQLINLPARIARSARKMTIHLPMGWLWATSWLTAWNKIMTPATA